MTLQNQCRNFAFAGSDVVTKPHRALRPASMTMFWTVMYCETSEQRNCTAARRVGASGRRMST